MSQKNDNFIDKTFTVLADLLLKVLPATKEEKKAFSYYRYGMTAQSNGDYAEALENYYEALKLEEDPFDRSYILYNIGLIYGNNGDYTKALEYYHQALDLNYRLPQALNNIAVIYHYQGTKFSERKDFELAQDSFDKASDYWKKAIRLAPNNYIEAQNWLKITGNLAESEL
jgi:tetratricopeptide (TPR) repeat protein